MTAECKCLLIVRTFSIPVVCYILPFKAELCSILSWLSKHQDYVKVTVCSVYCPDYQSTRTTSRWQCARYTVLTIKAPGLRQGESVLGILPWLSKHQDYVKVTMCSVYCPDYQSTRTTSRWQCARYTVLTIKAPGLRQDDSVLGILSWLPKHQDYVKVTLCSVYCPDYQTTNAQSSTWPRVDTLLTRKSNDLDFLSLARSNNSLIDRFLQKVFKQDQILLYSLQVQFRCIITCLLGVLLLSHY